MNKHTIPLCNSHVAHLNISRFLFEVVTSPFEKTALSIGEALSVPFIPPLYQKPVEEIVFDEQAVRRVVPVYSRASGEKSDKEAVAAVVGGVLAGVQSGA